MFFWQVFNFPLESNLRLINVPEEVYAQGAVAIVNRIKTDVARRRLIKEATPRQKTEEERFLKRTQEAHAASRKPDHLDGTSLDLNNSSFQFFKLMLN